MKSDLMKLDDIIEFLKDMKDKTTVVTTEELLGNSIQLLEHIHEGRNLNTMSRLEKIEFSIRMLYLQGYITDKQRESLDKKLMKEI